MMWPGDTNLPQQDAGAGQEGEATPTPGASEPQRDGDTPSEARTTQQSSLKGRRPQLWAPGDHSDGRSKTVRPATDAKLSPSSKTAEMGSLSPGATDRVFPIRSVVSVDPAPTPSQRFDKADGYFGLQPHGRAPDSRRVQMNTISESAEGGGRPTGSVPETPGGESVTSSRTRQGSSSTAGGEAHKVPPRQVAHIFSDIASSNSESINSSLNSAKEPLASHLTQQASSIPRSSSAQSSRSEMSRISGKSARTTESADETGGLLTARFKHVVVEGGHAIITGRDGNTLQRCEDEPIHIPGAVQSFGLLIALYEEADGKLKVRVVSENSKRIIGYTPKQLFALDSFCDILSEEQADNLLDHIDFIKDEDADVAINGPEVFTISIRAPSRRSQKLWCAIHVNERNSDLIICEFELEDDTLYPLVPASNLENPEPPEDTLHLEPTAEEYMESTQNSSRPLRVLRSARRRKGEAAAMEVFNIMSQVQEQLASAPNLEKFLKILVGVVKELTGFHRVMVYQFDQMWNGRVVTELVDPRATKDLYKGLNFPASDIPKQARDLYKINKVRLLYDRDLETARLVCRNVEDLENPLDLTYSYLRAMSPIHLKYLTNMAVRSSMSISINAFNELWGLIACHSYGSKGMRVAFPIRKMCRLVGDTASRNIERLSYASRLQARKLINTVPTQHNPSGYIVASSEDLLKLFNADYGLLSIRDETKILGGLEQSQEALVMLEYLRMRKITSVTASQDIKEDFPDLRYPPGFQVIAGLLLVPLSAGGHDFIVFFRRGQLREVKWAGNPYEKFVKEGTEGYLEPRKSFKTWSETVIGKCREWTEEEIETAAVLCLVYGKFIEVWREKEAALQNSQLTKLLLANSAHEVRTPLNAIINYLEIALEGSLDQETRDNLAKSHSASKSLIYVINDLLDLTKTEEGGELIKDEVFDLKATLHEATDMFRGDAQRKRLTYEVVEHPGIPEKVLGDQRRIRQAISNITANAIQNTASGGIKIEMYVADQSDDSRVDIEVAIQDSGVGMNPKKLDALFRDLEQVQSADSDSENDSAQKALTDGKEEKRTLGLGLAVVARIIRNMNGQLRLKSEEGRGSRFIISLPFDLPQKPTSQRAIEGAESTANSVSSSNLHTELPSSPPVQDGEVTLVDRDSQRRGSNSGRVSRKSSVDSLGSKNSKKSLRSMMSGGSFKSNRSGKSDVDRMIEAISEPHMVERPKTMEKRQSYNRSWSPASSRGRSGTLSTQEGPGAHPPEHLRGTDATVPGEQHLLNTRTPIKAVRMPEEEPPPAENEETASHVIGEVQDKQEPQRTIQGAPKKPDADHLRVLVAEDDPVNSRIIKKRLEKMGHEVYLTINGEECASAYGEKPGYFDIILMDMQMPIADGLTSTKMIRSYEKAHPTRVKNDRGSIQGRVPIFAVSASLEEKGRQQYIDAGFDAWILKPISFDRLNELMKGIADNNVRHKALYKAGHWESGGWFQQAQPDIFQASTQPSQDIPFSNPTPKTMAALDSDDPAAGASDENVRQDQEQKRLLESQARTREEAGMAGSDSSTESTTPQASQSPAPGDGASGHQ